MDGCIAFAPELARDNDGYPEEVFETLWDPEKESFWRRARKRLFTWTHQRYFPEASNFLEIGSGNGVILMAFRQAFPELVLWGSDIYTHGLEAIKEKVSDVNLFQSDARYLPFRDEFDVIGAFDVLEHIDEDEAVMSAMYRATKPGGGVLISVPQHPFLWSQRDEVLCHKRRYTRRELLGKLRKAGFELELVTSFITLPFPMMVLSAWRNRKPREDFDPFREVKVSRAANAAMNLVLDCERQAIKVGLSFPLGGTLLAVAKRPS
jgi:SAM-dependent methyltransferase